MEENISQRGQEEVKKKSFSVIMAAAVRTSEGVFQHIPSKKRE